MTDNVHSELLVSELWRYPIKSLHGERVTHSSVTSDGLRGDRHLHVRGERGLLTGRTRPELLTLRAATDDTGEVYVDGHPWHSDTAGHGIRQAAGRDAVLVANHSPQRFDVLPVLVATDAEMSRLGVDGRRLRPNIVISGAAPEEERTWPGRALRIGPDVVLGVDSVRLRCVVTTIDPDTGTQDLDVLRRIHRDFASRTALNCWVISSGAIHVGDEVVVEPLAPETVSDTHPGYDSWIGGAAYPTSK